MRKYNHNFGFFSNDSVQSFYWAGFIAADGCIVNNSLKIELAEKDISHLETFAKHIGATNQIKIRYGSTFAPNNKYVSLCLTSKETINDLKRFNIVPRKSLIYKFPNHLKDHKYISHFIRGYIDGDGSIFENNIKSANAEKTICLKISGTKDCLTSILNILAAHCYHVDRSKALVKQGKHYNLVFCSNRIVTDIMKFLLNGTELYLKRKWDIAKSANEYILYRGIDKDLLRESYLRIGTIRGVARDLKESRDKVKYWLRKYGLYS